MSKTECCTNNVQSEDEKSCSNRFEVMDELNRHYSERITIFENAGCTERLVASLKKWIEALIKHDKILISTIESLESEAIARSEKLSYLCKDRIQVEEKCEKYKQEISEKTELIKELNTRLKEQCETLNQKEYAIKRLKEELDQLNKSIDNVKNKNNTCNNPQDSSISDMNSQLEKLKKELNEKESKIKSLEEDLCSCKQKLDSIKDSPEHMGYNGRVNELEYKLQRAKEEICSLKKKLDTKDNEIISLKDKMSQSQNENTCDKMVLPDALLSSKLEEFQRFTEESTKKLHESLSDMKEHAKNLYVKEEMDEFNCYLNKQQEIFLKASKQLHAILRNIKNTNPAMGLSSNFKLQCLEKKLKNVYNVLENENAPAQPNQYNKDASSRLIENMMNKIQDCMKIISEIKKEAPGADSTDPFNSDESIKMIQEVQEMIKVIQNQSKHQQSQLFASIDNQKEDVGGLSKKFAEVDCLLKAHCKSITFVKDELKISLCNINQKADKVKKQADSMVKFECSVKEIANWANQNLKNNADVMNKIWSLQNNLKQVMEMKNALEDSNKTSAKDGKVCKTSSSVPRQSHSTPELRKNNTTEYCELDLNEFEDKCLLARDICDEVNKELEKATYRINEREQKLTHLSRDVSYFGETVRRIQDDIVHIADLIINNDKGECRGETNDYQQAVLHLQEYIKKLLQALCNIRHKLINHQKESDCYDIKGIESKKNITCKLNEMEEAFDDLSSVLGEMKESEYIKSRKAMTCDSEDGIEIREMTDDSSDMENASTQLVPQNNVIQQMRAEISHLTNSVSTLEKQNSCYLKTIETLKYQLNQAKEESEKRIQMMVSNLQEKCQPSEQVDKNEMTRLYKENKKLNQDITELKAILQCKQDKICMIKHEYVQLTQEVNTLTALVQQEKEISKNRECNLQSQNTELCSQVQMLKKKLHTVCLNLSSQQVVDDRFQDPSCSQIQLEDYKRQLVSVQEKYNCLLAQYKDLLNNYSNLKDSLKRKLLDRSYANKYNQLSDTSQNESCFPSDGKSEASCDKTDTDDELSQLKEQVYQLNSENERLNKENEFLNTEKQHVLRELQELKCENQQFSTEHEQYLEERNQLMCQLKSIEKEVDNLNTEKICLTKNNQLLSNENCGLKSEIETLVALSSTTKDKCDKYEKKYLCLKEQYEQVVKDKEEMRKEQCNAEDKMKIIRDEEYKENMALQQQYEEMKEQLACAQFKIDELQYQLCEEDKRKKESAMLEADTELLMTKSDKEWNEMYVQKCAEVLSLSEEIECMRNKFKELNSKIAERNEMGNKNKLIIATLKKTIQEDKAQLACLKSKLEKCLACNRTYKVQIEEMKANAMSMKQIIERLNKEKHFLVDKLTAQESEGSYDYDDSLC